MAQRPEAFPEISVVSPVYQAEKIVPELAREILRCLSPITTSFEIVLVEDGSRDKSWQAISQVCSEDPRIVGIRLSRNFGQHDAITAGLAASRGTWVVVMDCDLQDRPDQIPLLYAKALEGYETVCAQRVIRNDRYLKKISSQLFYKLFSYLTETEQDASIGNFGIYHRKVIEAILSMNDAHRYFPAMVQWVGFRKTKIQVKHASRFEGKTTYNFRRLTRLALNTIISFSDKPLRLVVLSGLAISGASFSIGIGYLIGNAFGLITVAGYTSIIVSIWLTAGMVILVLGIVGLYVGKSFEKIKMRPSYIIEEKLNERQQGYWPEQKTKSHEMLPSPHSTQLPLNR
jgi:dolichol-phosphate mannosyltransferase